MPEFPEGSKWSQIKAELNYIFTHSGKVTLSKNNNNKKKTLPHLEQSHLGRKKNRLSCSFST